MYLAAFILYVMCTSLPARIMRVGGGEEEVTPTRGTRQPYVTYEAESQSCKGTVRLNSLHHSNSNSRAFFVNGDFVFGADQRTKARMY